MSNIHAIVVATVAFFILIGLMVIVHELGHFAMAKLFKVRVEAFSFGFGPRLFGFRRGETDYKVCLLPLGGFVKMTGESPGEDQQTEDPAAFSSHPRWQRMVIGVAGPVANFVLAFLLMVFYFIAVNEVPNIRPAVIEWVVPSSAAGHAGLQPGDVVARFGRLDNPDFDSFVDLAKHSAGQTLPIVVDRGGQTVDSSIKIPADIPSRGYDLDSAGLYLQFVQGPIQIDQVVANTPAEQAGLRAGDTIVAADGHPFHTIYPLLAYLQQGKGAPITLTIKRDGSALAPIVVHPTIQQSEYRLGFTQSPPADPPVHDKPLPLYDAIAGSVDFCKENSTIILETISKIFSHQVSVKQLSGPVGIARMAGQAAEMDGWLPKFALASAISLNLGILNLLPFPILDGGMILFLLIESVLRHDINILVKERIYQAAFVLILVFFAFILFNDVTKLPIFVHLKP